MTPDPSLAAGVTVGAVELSVLGVVAVGVAALAAGAVQSSLGFGAAFVLVPVLAIAAPEVLPGAIIVAVVPLSMAMIGVRHAGLDVAAVGRVTLGRLPGIVAGGALVGALTTRSLTVAIAVLLLAAVVTSAAGVEVAVTRRSEVLAGAVSGLTGTAAGLGGPPLALLYRGEAGDRLRPTLAGVWLVGSLPALASLAAFGALTRDQVVVGALLGIGTVAGLVAAAPAVRRLPDDVLRRAVRWWAAAGALAAIARALTLG